MTSWAEPGEAFDASDPDRSGAPVDEEGDYLPGRRRALLVVDVQNDFCEGGSLPVTGGAAVAAAISELLRARGEEYAAIATTQDWHLDPGRHFARPPAEPDYVDTWPPHCVVGTPGAQLHANLDTELVMATFRKGRHEAAYSGFEGTTHGPGGREETLADWLTDRAVVAVDIVGLATDHCVRATALDAVTAGFQTRVLLDLTAGVARPTTAAALDQLRGAGVRLSGRPVLA